MLTRSQFALCISGVLLALSSLTARADDALTATPAGRIQITIRNDGAVIRERVEAVMPGKRARILLPDVPVEADPSSLHILGDGGDLKLLEWSVPVFKSESGVRGERNGDSVRIDFEKGGLNRQSVPEITVETARPGRKQFDLVYTVADMSWSSSYDVLLRGDLLEIEKRLSMDAEGWIKIENNTSRTFSNAAVAVIGPDELGEAVLLEKEPGILDLDDDSPLADLWRDLPRDPKTSHVYPLRKKVTLPANGSVLVSHVSVTRKPVQRVLLLRAEEIPTDTFTRFAIPSQIITIQNESDYGGNQAVPPGPALIHVGNQRSALQQKAWFKHTAANGEIRIDMGKIDGFRVRRLNRGRNQFADGGYEQIFEIRIENLLDQNAHIIVDEEPPVYNLAWSLVRANYAHEAIGRRLVFDLNVKPNAEKIIQYTVRYSLPEQ